ncbi:hypothetical protein CHLRE_12g507004v5 [Chlamydomonas reinhardtii]|uniref:Uncharacterized protein n=1 Tax=Chlamydomonas reinhardtii TaxID=3055 RepID=A0A2K3D2V4_CHLRE|nr:uncharacterized protein CHLRE_12g507004v5 [Chlamydomonas reinhardtii]PNW74866.1 hypothetical protein CHLRE_12g507004v5 [Chlamydomonas reinhardtii]
MFTCPICGRAPRSLICNATVITFLVQFYRGTPLTTQAAPLSDAIGMRAHKRAHKRVDRCWCPEKKGSAAVRGFSSALRGDGRDVYGQSVPSWVAAADSAKQHSSPAALGALNESVPEADRSASLTVGFMRIVSGAANAVGGAQAPRLAVACACADVVESQQHHQPHTIAPALGTHAKVVADGAPVLLEALAVL